MAHLSRTTRAVLLAVLAALVAGAPSAHAAKGVVGVFGAGDFGGNSPRGVAVNETTGDVYVADGGGHRVRRYSATGAFLSQIGSGSSSNVKGNFNSPHGVAVNQVDGSVWVTDSGNLRVQKFDAPDVFGVHAFNLALGWDVISGAPTTFEVCGAADTCKNGTAGSGDGQFSGSATTFTGHLSVDPATGSVYVPDPVNRRFQRLSSAGAFQAKFGSSAVFGSASPSRSAVDSAGVVYVIEVGSNRVQRCVSLGGAPETFSCTSFAANHVTGKFPYAVAVDRGDNHVYVATRPDDPDLSTSAEELQVIELESDGDLVAVHGVGAGITTSLSPSNLNNYGGLAVNSTTDAVYMTVPHGTSTSRRVFILDDVVAPTTSVAPTTDVTSTTATFNGTVNPNGSQTSYRFEHSRDGGGTWTPFPASDVDVGSGAGDVVVSQAVTGLEPSSQYLVRLVATKPFNAATTISAEETFATAPAPPGVSAVDAVRVGDTGARLRGRVDPNGEATTYRFEYGTDTGYGSQVPVPDGDAGADVTDAFVVHELSGLQPSTTYHFRLLATNASGTTTGADQTFTTDATPPGPEGRVYELVSSNDTNLNDVFRVPPAADDGETIPYKALGAPEGAPSNHHGATMLARRTPEGWTQTHVAVSEIPGDYGQFTAPAAFDPTFSTVALHSGFSLTAVDDDNGREDVYRLDIASGAVELQSVGAVVPDADTGRIGQYAGSSKDLSHIVFEVNNGAPLTPDMQASKWLYERVGGVTRSVSVVGSGEFQSQFEIAATFSQYTGFENGSPYAAQSAHGGAHAVSDDGSRIYFKRNGSPSGLFLREDGTTTIAVSRSRRAGDPPTASAVRFIAATPDGSKAYFTSVNPLTDDATGGENLYRFDADQDTLELLTDDSDPAGDDTFAWAIASDDGSHVYFVSTAALDGAAVHGQANAYVWTEDGPRFITAVTPGSKIARVSRDGRYAVIETTASLGDALVGGHDALYLYDAATGGLACASCPANGSSSEGDASLVAIPLGAPMAEDLTRPRNVTDDGRLFFTSTDRLVPEDASSVRDVYEFHDGDVRLVSSGHSNYASFVADNSDDGEDLFFLTRDPLVKGDDDGGQLDLYDARIGGGFAEQEGPPAACEGDGCQAPPADRPDLAAPSTASFAGPGDERDSPRASFSLGRLSQAQLARLARGRGIALRVRVNGAGRVTATGRARLSGRRRLVATGSGRARRAGTVVLRLRLSSAARRRIASGHRLRVTVSVRFAAAPEPRTLRFELRPVRPNGR